MALPPTATSAATQRHSSARPPPSLAATWAVVAARLHHLVANGWLGEADRIRPEGASVEKAVATLAGTVAGWKVVAKVARAYAMEQEDQVPVSLRLAYRVSVCVCVEIRG